MFDLLRINEVELIDSLPESWYKIFKQKTLGDDEYDWSILEVLEEPLQIDLKTSFGFFSNGMGDRVAIDYFNCENDNATLRSAKDQPEYNINFWDVVDEWIVIGFEME